MDEISFWDKVIVSSSSQESLRKDLPQWEDVLFDFDMCWRLDLSGENQPTAKFSNTDSLLKGH